jgi:hypothetical protein
MSEAWHQHLGNLSWWEQIDRFFNPGKYSCTTTIYGDWIWHIFLIILIVIVAVTIVLFWLTKREANKVFNELAFDKKLRPTNNDRASSI